MALPVYDDFSPDENPLVTNWTTVVNDSDCKAASGVGRGTIQGECGVWWDADAFGNDQYSKFTLAGLAASNQCSAKVSVRIQPSVKTFYCFGTDDATNWLLQKCVEGTWVDIASGFVTHTAVAGNILKLSVSGANPSVLAWDINNGEHSGTNNSDSAIDSGGAAGWVIYHSGSSVDDWEGGNVGAAAGQPAIKRFGGVPYAAINKGVW